LSNEWVSLQRLDTPILKNNLTALAVMDAELLETIQKDQIQSSLVFQQKEGYILCRTDSPEPEWLFGKTDPRDELLQIRDELNERTKDASLVVLTGSVIGYALAYLLPKLTGQPPFHVIVVEPSPDRVLATLALLDMRNAFQAGRLHFAVGNHSLDGILHAMEPFNLWGHEPAAIYFAPENQPVFDPADFQQRYQEKSERQFQDQQSFIHELKHRPEIEVGTPVKNVLLLDCWPGAPGGTHIAAIRNELHRRNLDTRYLALERYRMDTHSLEYRRVIEPKLTAMLESFQPDLVLSYGYHAPRFVSEAIYESLHGQWLQVVSNIAYYDTDYYPRERTALIEKNLIPYFERRGAHDPFFVPLMADYTAEVLPQTDRRFPIVFVGNSLGMSPQAVAEFHKRWKGRDELLDYIDEREKALSIFDPAINLYNTLDRSPIPQVTSEEESYAVFRYLLNQGSAARRRRLLEKIAPLGLVLFGGDWTAYLPPESPLHRCLRGYLTISEEPNLFQFGHLFVNIHSIGHVTGPNMRFFNVPGMGGFQITDGPELNTFLEDGSEAVFYSSEDEFLDRIRYYLDHTAEADEIRSQGFERVKKDWTYRNWVDWVFEELGIQNP